MASSKVLSRLRKLLALARSTNAHEAESARAKAEEIMARHSLTEADAAVAGPDEVVEVPVGARGFQELWKFKLAAVAARACDCEALGLRVGKRRKVRLVGVRSRVAEASQLLEVFVQEVLRLARVEMRGAVDSFRRTSPGRVRRLSERYLRYFREGLVDGLAALLSRCRREAQATPGEPAAAQATGGGDGSRAQGLVRVESRGEAPGVRERLKASGARVVEDESDDDVFDEFAETAYRSGFRQAGDVNFPGKE